MRIAFAWLGISGRYGQWKDGLWAAMQEIEKRGHTVQYFEPYHGTQIRNFQPDVVLFWEAACTAAGPDAAAYRTIQNLPFKKALLFAGGPIKKEWLEGFDLVFVESAINEEELEQLGVPWKRAFGVNTQAFRPEPQPKIFDAVFPATCASWKRPWLLTETLRERSVICGRFQETDPLPFIRSRAAGALVLPELSAEGVNSLIAASHTLVNCSDFWGGGQRATLEGMANGAPVIVMEDSPKNREYIEESGCGMVVPPEDAKIREAVEHLKATWTAADTERSLAYIRSKWTEKHYADAILEGIIPL